MSENIQDFQPDWTTPPGSTIYDLMLERGWNQTELAERLGYSTKHLSQLINGKITLTDNVALRLERVLGSSSEFWLNREANYRDRLARLKN